MEGRIYFTILALLIITLVTTTALPRSNQSKKNEKEKKNWIKEKKMMKDIEHWNKVQKDIKKNGKGHYKMKNDKASDHFPKEMKEKVNKGQKLKRKDLDKFENDYGFRSKSGMVVTDFLDTINRAHDVILKEADIVEHTSNQNKGKQKRDSQRDRVYLWMDRTVPYEVDLALAESKDVIESALGEIQGQTCIKFVPRTTQSNWIKFVSKSGCWSNVGKLYWENGFQEISLGNGCIYKGIIMHEVMHALGFFHEQNRADRDQYVEIFWENIPAGRSHNFDKKAVGIIDSLNEKYDYGSIMHYGKYSFAIDPSKITIQDPNNPSRDLGQRNNLSPTDIAQINKLYSCSVSGEGWSEWSDYSQCDQNCKKTRQRFCMHQTDKTSCANPVSTRYISYGLDEVEVNCSLTECYAPVDGHWNKWGSWSGCSVTCDIGSQTRKRECTDPAPKNGGKACVGSNVETKECKMRGCDEGPYDCTFDFDGQPMCGWTLDPTGNFQWIRNSGGTPSSSTGPNEDHTSGTGYYLYIETSSPAILGDKARLLSPVMSASTRCMHFAYSMYGFSTGSLSVKVKDTVTGDELSVFTKAGDQLNSWHEQKFDVNAPNPYQVIIEGVRGTSFQGDIGIDDIVIHEGSCNSPIPTLPPPVPSVVSVGCYHDKGYIDGKRPFTNYTLLNDVIKWSKDWDLMKASLMDVMGNCSAFALTNKFEYFAIQNSYECWTGPSDEVNYGRDGESVDCWPGPEDAQGPYIVGRKYTNMVYKWKNTNY